MVQTPLPAQSMAVLLVTGDWKSQAWYQDVWMKGHGQALFRGRFIAAAVDRVAPGRFTWTDITNYAGQEYMDAGYLSQFDVVVLGDVVGWSISPRIQAALSDYVAAGGGLMYCASWKWSCTMPCGTPLAKLLPATFPVDDLSDDWQDADLRNPDADFLAVLADPGHPMTRGLDWASLPTLSTSFRMDPRPTADVLLKTPHGAPILAAWTYGKGRSAMSASIFANDELSPKVGSWKDFGRFYAQTLTWLGAHAPGRPTALHDATAAIDITVDTTSRNPIPPALFSVHGAEDCPGFSPLEGKALAGFQALHPKGGFARFAANCETARGVFDFKDVDHELSECRRLGLEPLALFAAYSYGGPPWMWTKGTTWAAPTDREVSDIVGEVSGFLAHVDGRTGQGQKLHVRYIELFNEPTITPRNVDGYARIITAVVKMVHRDYPGVLVGGLGGYEVPYYRLALDRVGNQLDWISRHPYGWTGEMVFSLQDEMQAYARSHGIRPLHFIITEWDFWIQGRQKFDYMMKRYFAAVRRTDLLGTIHYRFGMYTEPVYIFGIMWGGYGQDHGAGAPDTPIHDAYDALWIFRDFRGSRVRAQVALGADAPQDLADHVFAAASVDGDRADVVVYQDWADDGTGYKDYPTGRNISRIKATLHITLPPSTRARILRVSKATGEGFSQVGTDLPVPAGQGSCTVALQLEPVTALAVQVQ